MMNLSILTPNSLFFKFIGLAVTSEVVYYLYNKLQNDLKMKNAALSQSNKGSDVEGKKLLVKKNGTRDQSMKNIDIIIFTEDSKKCQTHSNKDPCELPSCPIRNIIKLKTLFNSAKKSIDVCIYLFTNNPLAKLLIELHKKNIRVRIILDGDSASNTSTIFMDLLNSGIEIKAINPGSDLIIHHKFAIIDEQLLISGSANWTNKAFFGNCENIFAINDPKSCEQMGREFQRLWDKPDCNFTLTENNRRKKMGEVMSEQETGKHRYDFD